MVTKLCEHAIIWKSFVEGDFYAVYTNELCKVGKCSSRHNWLVESFCVKECVNQLTSSVVRALTRESAILRLTQSQIPSRALKRSLPKKSHNAL